MTKDLKHYRGTALQSTLRRMLHPATPVAEVMATFQAVRKLDPDLRFIDTLDPDYSRLPEWHPTAIWRARLSAVEQERDAAIAERNALKKRLARSAKLVVENTALKAELARLRRAGVTDRRSTPITISPHFIEVSEDDDDLEDTGLPFLLMNSTPIECQLGERRWDSCNPHAPAAKSGLFWSDLRTSMILLLIQEGMTIEEVKERHFSEIFRHDYTEAKDKKKKYKYHPECDVTIRRKNANACFNELRKYAAFAKLNFRVVVRFRDANRIKNPAGSGNHMNDPAMPGLIVEIVQPIGKPQSWREIEFTFTPETFQQTYRLLHDERLTAPKVADIMRCTVGQIYGKFGNVPLDEKLIGREVPIRMGQPMDYLELWKIGRTIYGQKWKEQIPLRFGRKNRSLRWDDPTWLSTADGDKLRHEYLDHTSKPHASHPGKR